MTEETAHTIRAIKQELHAMMNGPVSNSLRDKGLRYRIIYGVEWNRLLDIAASLGQSSELAGALWKEDIRECRLLAGLVQPADEFPEELAEIWIEDMHYPEEAQYTTMTLFQNLPYAKKAAFKWIARENGMYQLCGFLLFARLFMKNDKAVDDRSANEFLDQAQSLIRTDNAALKSAVTNALMRYASMGEIETVKSNRILEQA